MRTAKQRLAGALATAAAVSGTVLAAPAPAHAAWGTTETLSMQATGTNGFSSTDVGSANGWVQFDDGGTTFRYSLTICRQSGYVWPRLEIDVNAWENLGTWYGTYLDSVSMPSGTPVSTCYGGGDTVTGTETTTHPWDVEFILSGGYFNQTFSYVTDRDVVNNPY